MSDTEYRVQVLDRAFALLDVLAGCDSAMGATELGERVGLNKSTVHRLLAVLERNRYVERDVESGRFRLGLKLVQLGSIALSRFDLHRRARPFVERLMEETGETAHLGVLRQNEIISLVNAESQRSVRTPSTVGRRSPLHCTSQGKAVAAFQTGRGHQPVRAQLPVHGLHTENDSECAAVSHGVGEGAQQRVCH